MTKKTVRPMDEATQEMQRIRERLAEEPVWFQRTVDAWAECEERNLRWRQQCPPHLRQGNHLHLEDGRSYKADLDRQTTEELKAERFTYDGLPDHSTTVSGLLDVGKTTITKEEWRRLRR